LPWSDRHHVPRIVCHPCRRYAGARRAFNDEDITRFDRWQQWQ
jgi:hypothetical protein